MMKNMEKNKNIIKIKGDAYVYVYKFDGAFVEESVAPKSLREKFDGGLGAVIVATYEDKDVSTHTDLYFIPGKFDIDGESKYIITRAYTSTEEAKAQGLFCKKEVVDLRVEENGAAKTILFTKNNRTIFSIETEDWGFDFPISSDVIHFPLMTIEGDIWSYTGKGTAKFTKMNSIEVRPSKFPDVAEYTPLASVHIRDFEMEVELIVK